MRMAELTSQVTFRVSDELYDAIQRIALFERRRPNEAARALLERGIAAYERDQNLFEPEATQQNIETSDAPQRAEGYLAGYTGPTIRVRKRQGGKQAQTPDKANQPRRKIS